jgi:CelD/BcsL family acetyltransferase involved in cellulose biosynthesis
MGDLSIEVIDSMEKLTGIENDWNKLLACSDLNMPMLSFEWMQCWWKSYSGNNRMMIVVVREHNDAIVIAPFMKTKTRLMGITVNALTFIANEHTQRCGILFKRCDVGLVKELFKAVKEMTYDCDAWLFDAIPEDSFTDLLLKVYAGRNRLHSVTVPSLISPYLAVKDEWEAYLKRLSKSFRKEIRNTVNNIIRQGDCTLKRYSAPSDVPRAMEELLYVSQRTWKHKEGTAIASRSEDTQFYTLLAHSAACRGWLDIWLLYHKDIPIGAAFNLLMDQKLYGLKIKYDQQYSSLAPGKYLNYCMIKTYTENGIAEIDLMGSNDHHKMQWQMECRPHRKYIVFNSLVYGRLLYAMKRTGLFLQQARAHRERKQVYSYT